jgi:excisionase family DNA binding protein
MEKLFTVDEVADAFRINKQTVLRFIREGKIKAYKVGREYRVKEEEVNAYLTRVFQ